MKISYIDIKYAYRTPNEFEGLGTRKLGAIMIWLIHGWNTDMCNIWRDIGFRILGMEVNFTIWLKKGK